MSTQLNYISLKPHNMRALLVEEALNWIGTTEQIEDNRGQMVERFQKSIQLAPGNSWCLAYIWYCISRVESQAKALDDCFISTELCKTGHVLTCWKKTPSTMRIEINSVCPGDLILWNNPQTGHGHAGIILRNNYDGSFRTIEGNTSDSSGFERNGDGVFPKTRLSKGYSNTKVLGFLRVWN